MGNDNQTFGKLVGQPNVLKEVNKNLIKVALADLKVASRVEIATQTGISQPTVNSLINELMEDGSVIESGVADSSGGRKAIRYSLNSDMSHCLSLVFEQNEMEYTVANLENTVLKHEKVTRTDSWTLDDIKAEIGKIIKGNENVKVIVIGVPGAVFDNGDIVAIPKIPCLEGVNLQEALEKEYKLKVIVKNDINVIALGYYKKHLEIESDLICLHLGNTLGAGIIIDGKILTGNRCFAGEIGYMQLDRKISRTELNLVDFSEQDRNECIARIVVNMVCTINPGTIILGGKSMNDNTVRTIQNLCGEVLPDGMIPKIERLETERDYYLEGLTRIGIDMVTAGITLVAGR